MRPSRVLINPVVVAPEAAGASPRAVVGVKVVEAVAVRVDAVVKAEEAKVQTVAATAVNRYFLLLHTCGRGSFVPCTIKKRAFVRFFIALKLPGFIIFVLSALHLAQGTKFQISDAGVIFFAHKLI